MGDSVSPTHRVPSITDAKFEERLRSFVRRAGAAGGQRSPSPKAPGLRALRLCRCEYLHEPAEMPHA
jgi:hypothetical protein